MGLNIVMIAQTHSTNVGGRQQDKKTCCRTSCVRGGILPAMSLNRYSTRTLGGVKSLLWRTVGSDRGIREWVDNDVFLTRHDRGLRASYHEGMSSRSNYWDTKSDIYILRSDGFSCTRETVTSDSNLKFEHPSSQQHLLVWKTRPKCVMVLKKLGEELVDEFMSTVRFLGVEEGLRVLIEPAEYARLEAEGVLKDVPFVDTWGEDDSNRLHQFVDFVVCLGGDGLMLHATHVFGSAIPPIISFKMGSLGFLTCHGFENAREHLHAVINGTEELETCRLTNSVDGSPLTGVRITLRMRLLCELYRAGQRVPAEVHEVLNEVVLARGSAPYLSKIDVYDVHDERETYLTRVQADGVMLATPTGSTAYSVAAGGSMVHPTVPAILFTPICPHSLSFRPVILPDYAKIVLRIAGDARSGAVATFDGKFTTEMQPGDAIHVCMSPHPVPTINYEDQTTDWFNSIERCFKWNDRLEQKKMDTVPKVSTTPSPQPWCGKPVCSKKEETVKANGSSSSNGNNSY